MHRHRLAIVILPVTTLGLALAFAPLSQPGDAQPDQPQAPQGPDFGQMLIDGLESTEGCLGVESARYTSGKLGIIAWFESVDAAERWYYSETHKRFMAMAGSNAEAREPMQHIHDRATPVMVMASITMGGEGPKIGMMPISQISIEMYTPLPGGAAINGRLSPETFPIDHFRRLGG